MKLVHTLIPGMAVAMPQGPTGNFNAGDIQNVISNMGADSDQAAALFDQFSALQGFDRSTVSNRPVNTVSSANADDELGAIGAFRMAAGYGCWCYFGDQHLLRQAKGAPVDKMDELCKQLHNNYECLLMDTENSNDGECRAWEQDHSINFLATPESTDTELRVACANANDGFNTCKTNACTIEATFVRDFGILMESGNFIPYESGFHYVENGGLLEENPRYLEIFRASNCYGVPGHENPAPACCGNYPNRIVYNSSIRGCCTPGGASLSGNPTLFHYGNDMECCDDGTVIEGGSGRADCEAV